MKKLFSLFLAVLTCSAIVLPSFAHAAQTTESTAEDSAQADVSTITAGSAIVADLNTGKVLYKKNADAKLYPASLTKIMTAMIALDNSNLTDTITVSENAVTSMQQKGVMRMSVIAGQQMTMKEALHALLINSANDIAVAIAEHISGSTEDFTALMNEYAKNLGCTQTNFSNPTGLDADNLSTSALDMAVICKKAAENSTFLKICGAKTFTFESTIMDGKGKPIKDDYILTNQHKMISGEFPYEYAYAGKTGYTNAGQTTLATYAKKDTMNLVAVVLGCPGENDAAYEDTKKLLEHCFANYDTLSENSTKTLMLTEQNDLLSDTPAKMPETESAVTDTDTQSAIINAVKGHSWQDYIVIGAIALAAVVLIVLIIRQTVIYAKRRRRRKNYERMKKQRIEEEKENNS